MKQTTKEAIDKLLKKWFEVRYFISTSKKDSYTSEFESPIGRLWWDNLNVVWVFSTSNEEGYEGSQTQIGITKDGKLKWEYQSHCSCDGYEDSKDLMQEFPEEFSKLTTKSYELQQIPDDYEDKIVENIEKLLKETNV